MLFGMYLVAYNIIHDYSIQCVRNKHHYGYHVASISVDTIESGYLAHAPDDSATASCVLDNGTHGLASGILLTPPPIMIP